MKGAKWALFLSFILFGSGFIIVNSTQAAAFTVTTTSDSGPGSLRAAIMEANTSPGEGLVNFNIPAEDPGCLSYLDDGQPGSVDYSLGETGCLSADADPDLRWWRISLDSHLPEISDASGGLEVLGESQADFLSDTNPWGPEIEIVGPPTAKDSFDKDSPEQTSSIWRITSANNKISNLAIRHPYSAGVLLFGGGATGNQISGCHVGINVTGEQSFPNSSIGIMVAASPGGNIIGGPNEGEGNLISHSFRAGVFLLHTKNNLIEGNQIQNSGWIQNSGYFSGPLPFMYEGQQYENISSYGSSLGVSFLGKTGGDPVDVPADDTKVATHLEERASYNLALLRSDSVGIKATLFVHNDAFSSLDDFLEMMGEELPDAQVGCWVNDILTRQDGQQDFDYTPIESWDRSYCPGEVSLITDYSSREAPYLEYRSMEGQIGAGIGLQNSASNKIYSNHIKGNAYGLILKGSSVMNEIGGEEKYNFIHSNIEDGIALESTSSYSNRIRINSFYANGQMGIDVGNDGPDLTNMSLLEGQGGGPAGDKLAPPMFGITREDFLGEEAVVVGRSAPGSLVVVYSDGKPSSDGISGQGAKFLAVASADEEGRFSTSIAGLPTGARLTAMSYDSQGRVSEFSQVRTNENVVRVDLGQEEEDRLLVDGRVFLSDREWGGESYGHIGGEPVDPGTLGGHSDAQDGLYFHEEYGQLYGTPYFGKHQQISYFPSVLHNKHLEGLDEYKVEVSPGNYVLRLHFKENSLEKSYGHGPEQRVFDIEVEGEVLHSSLDLYQEAGRLYPMKVTLPVSVSDGTLNLRLVSLFGPNKLDAIELYGLGSAALPDLLSPSTDGLEGFQRNTVYWSREDSLSVSSYSVYRADGPGDEFVQMNQRPVLVDFYNDDSAEAGETYYYSVRSHGVGGQESDLSDPVALTAADISESDLPTYYLEVSEEDLQFLDDDIWASDYVPATFHYNGTRYDVEARYRGGITRNAHQKSWKVKFKDSQLFQDGENERKKVNLNNLFDDSPKIIQSAFYLWDNEHLNTIGRDTRHVNLMVNGEYAGLFHEVEQIDEHFLGRNGLDKDGSIYKGGGGFADFYTESIEGSNYEYENGRHPDLLDLRELSTLLEGLEGEELAEFLHEEVNMDSVLDYYASIILLHMLDVVQNNHFVYRDEDTGKWEMIITDPGSFVVGDTGLDFGTVANPEPRHTASGSPGVSGSPDHPNGVNLLFEKLLSVEEFRYAHAQNIRRILGESFNSETFLGLIRPVLEQIDDERIRDVNKITRHTYDPDNIANMEEFIGGSVDFYAQELGQQVYSFMPGAHSLPGLLHINEVYMGPDGSPWIEIYNGGHVKFDLGGMYLTNDPEYSQRWAFPAETYLGPGEHLVVQADGEGHGLHASFLLVPGHDNFLGIYDIEENGNEEFDRMFLPEQVSPTSSWGRAFDGAEEWQEFPQPTPGDINSVPTKHAPEIADLIYHPLAPRSGEPVTITALVTDQDSNLADVILHYDAGLGFRQAQMGIQRDGYYSATIRPEASADGMVEFYIEAIDTDRLAAVYPDYAPVLTRKYILDLQKISINELMADNDSVVADEAGEFDDWFELYNPNENHIELNDLYLSDKKGNPLKWSMNGLPTLEPGEYRVFWADEDQRQGPTHTNFKLSAGGEMISLYFARDGMRIPLDVVEFPAMETDTAHARIPDASENWEVIADPEAITPGESNDPPETHDPDIAEVSVEPGLPQEGEEVAVRAAVQDPDDDLDQVLLHYDVGAGYESVEMFEVSEGVREAIIPAQPDSALVSYYIEATDATGLAAFFPQDAPGEPARFLVGLPVIYVNELMADNDSVVADEAGEFDDWFELYYYAEEESGLPPVNLKGYYLSDSPSNPQKWQIAEDLMIDPGTHLLFWADDDEEQGALHTNLKLSAGGESLILYYFSEEHQLGTVIDEIDFPDQTTDVSYGRWPDGTQDWRYLAGEDISPGFANPFHP